MSPAHCALIVQQLISQGEPLLTVASCPQSSQAVTSCCPHTSHFPAIESPIKWGEYVKGEGGSVYLSLQHIQTCIPCPWKFMRPVLCYITSGPNLLLECACTVQMHWIKSPTCSPDAECSLSTQLKDSRRKQVTNIFPPNPASRKRHLSKKYNQLCFLLGLLIWWQF